MPRPPAGSPGAGQAEYALASICTRWCAPEFIEDGAPPPGAADGQDWLFRASGLQIGLEESIFLGRPQGPRHDRDRRLRPRGDYPALSGPLSGLAEAATRGPGRACALRPCGRYVLIAG